MNHSSKIHRRKFLKDTAVGATAVGLGGTAISLGGTAISAMAEEGNAIPSKNAMAEKGIALSGQGNASARNKVGLYSITFLGVWYRGDALTLDELIIKARELGYDGIEIDGKRPHGNPLDMPSSRCRELKRKAGYEGLEIYAVSANNDFSSPIPEHRECQIVYLRELIRMTSDLGVKPLRVFLAWPGVTLHPEGGRYDIARDIWQYSHSQFEPEQVWDWCRASLTECAKYAEDHGVTLALQNHKPVIRDWKDMMRMIEEVDSPGLKACLDAPIMEDKSPGNMMEAARAAGDLQVLTHFGGEFGRDAEGNIVDVREYDENQVAYEIKKVEEYLPDFVNAMDAIGYEGYYSYELCHPLPVVNGKKVGIDYVEKSAALASKMMKGLLELPR